MLAGQVRCGKCSRVFDALEYLSEEIAPARELPATHAHSAARALSTAAIAGPESTPAEFVLPAAAADSHTDAREHAIAAIAAIAEVEAKAEAREPAIESSAKVEAETTQAAAGMFEREMIQPILAQPASVEPWAAAGASSFDFGPGAAADPAKRARWPWLLGAFLLLLVLFTQAAYHYRSAIVVLFPEAKPYAAKLCASLGCELPLPRRIKQMSIEASDLQADTSNPDIMVLSATLKNRAIFDQQFPLLELTLTDAQDQPLVRRVLAPQDYIGKVADTQAGFAANTEIAIKVFIEGSQVKATGYRLYLFYP